SRELIMTRRRTKRSRNRSGTAIVELAVCLPAIVLLVLGSMEACTMVFVRQSLHISAYEGIRTAIKPEGTAADAIARANQILDERRVRNANVQFVPTFSDEPGTPLTLRISAPAVDNSVMPLQFFGGDLESQVTMVKE
ncbi:MAG: pilus assembly protein, partial [Planctomycetales bacterium]|nr:pilus assembly protein [Planctomycetales bacterium]